MQIRKDEGLQKPDLLLIKLLFSLSENQKLFPVMEPVQTRAQKQPRLLPQSLNSVSYIWTCEHMQHTHTHMHVHTQDQQHTTRGHVMSPTLHVKNSNFL